MPMLPGIILNCLSQCELTQRKRVRPVTKGVVVRPILSKEFSARGQVDLIDMQSLPHGSVKWIIVYQDHLTKFVVIRPLTSKRAAEVAYQLMDIFLLFGAPHILQSDNGSEFIILTHPRNKHVFNVIIRTFYRTLTLWVARFTMYYN
jgi:hypothetical protein